MISSSIPVYDDNNNIVMELTRVDGDLYAMDHMRTGGMLYRVDENGIDRLEEISIDNLEKVEGGDTYREFVENSGESSAYRQFLEDIGVLDFDEDPDPEFVEFM